MRGARFIVLALTVGLVALIGEVALRLIDGYRLTSLRLVPVKAVDSPLTAPLTVWPSAGANDVAAPHLRGIPVPAGVDQAWFFSDPPPPPAKPGRPDLEALSSGIPDQTLGKFARRIW